MLDQTSSDYQNPQAILDIYAPTKPDGNKTQLTNDYCRTNETEECKAEMCGSDAVTDEGKFLKQSDGE